MKTDDSKQIENLVTQLVDLAVAVAKEYRIDDFTYRSMPTPSIADQTPQCTMHVVFEDGEHFVAYGDDTPYDDVEEWTEGQQVDFLIVSDAFIRALIRHGRWLVEKRKLSVAAAEATLDRFSDFRNVDLESKVE